METQSGFGYYGRFVLLGGVTKKKRFTRNFTMEWNGKWGWDWVSGWVISMGRPVTDLIEEYLCLRTGNVTYTHTHTYEMMF